MRLHKLNSFILPLHAFFFASLLLVLIYFSCAFIFLYSCAAVLTATFFYLFLVYAVSFCVCFLREISIYIIFTVIKNIHLHMLMLTYLLAVFWYYFSFLYFVASIINLYFPYLDKIMLWGQGCVDFSIYTHLNCQFHYKQANSTSATSWFNHSQELFNHRW